MPGGEVDSPRWDEGFSYGAGRARRGIRARLGGAKRWDLKAQARCTGPATLHDGRWKVQEWKVWQEESVMLVSAGRMLLVGT